jgi:phosphoenolpyruvate---glycerone phosphotransferase subunit DhaL
VTDEVVTVDRLVAWVQGFAKLIGKQKGHLTELDAAIGDGDHGINMDRGMRAVCDKLGSVTPGGPSELFQLVGMTLVSNVGGASGPLYGTFFLRLGPPCGTSSSVALAVLVEGLYAGVRGVAERGHAELGDKTMLDSLQPAIEALDKAVSAGARAAAAFSRARDAAVSGRDATVSMVARKGRASYLGQRSAGHQDPGATSAALLFEAASSVLSAAG